MVETLEEHVETSLLKPFLREKMQKPIVVMGSVNFRPCSNGGAGAAARRNIDGD